MTSKLKGKWCGRCNGRGWLSSRSEYLDIQDQCPDCEFVGFVGLTSVEVRQAEIESMENADA